MRPGKHLRQEVCLVLEQRDHAVGLGRHSGNFSPQFNHGHFLQNILRGTGIYPMNRRKQRDSIRRNVLRYDDPPAPQSWVMLEALPFGIVRCS